MVSSHSCDGLAVSLPNKDNTRLLHLKECRKVSWEDRKSTTDGKMTFNGIPFAVLGRKRVDCQFGKDRKKNHKEKMYMKTHSEQADHLFYGKVKKYNTEESKKIDCPARCLIREICRFPTYKIDAAVDSPIIRKMNADEILYRIRNDQELEYERVFIVCFPAQFRHTCHVKHDIVREPMDQRLITKLEELYEAGVWEAEDMQERLRQYVAVICDPLPHPESARFYPTAKNIKNHMYRYQKHGQEIKARWALLRNAQLWRKRQENRKTQPRKKSNRTKKTKKNMGTLDSLASYADDIRRAENEEEEDNMYDDSFNLVQYSDIQERTEEVRNAWGTETSVTSSTSPFVPSIASSAPSIAANVPAVNPRVLKKTSRSRSSGGKNPPSQGPSVAKQPNRTSSASVVGNEINISRPAMISFFESCAIRAQSLSQEKQGWLQMQVSALMFQAETSVIVYDTDSTVQNRSYAS